MFHLIKTSSRLGMACINSEFVPVNGVPTKVFFTGAQRLPTNAKHVALIIPGNPGAASYYQDFMESLRGRLSSKDMPIWAIAHAGHEVPFSSESSSQLLALNNNTKHIYSLQGQIQHKLDFIEEYIPRDCKITLIGHSVGCRMAIDLVKRLEGSGRQVRGYMLFPMIEYMYETPSGRGCWIFCAYFTSLVCLFVHALKAVLSQDTLKRLVSWHLSRGNSSTLARCAIPSTLDLLNPLVIEKCNYLAYTEILEVKERDTATLKQHLEIWRFYCGTRDHWFPMSFVERLQRDIEGLDVEVDPGDLEHAFVLHHSSDVADVVARWFAKDQSKPWKSL